MLSLNRFEFQWCHQPICLLKKHVDARKISVHAVFQSCCLRTFLWESAYGSLHLLPMFLLWQPHHVRAPWNRPIRLPSPTPMLSSYLQIHCFWPKKSALGLHLCSKCGLCISKKCSIEHVWGSRKQSGVIVLAATSPNSKITEKFRRPWISRRILVLSWRANRNASLFLRHESQLFE